MRSIASSPDRRFQFQCLCLQAVAFPLHIQECQGLIAPSAKYTPCNHLYALSCLPSEVPITNKRDIMKIRIILTPFHTRILCGISPVAVEISCLSLTEMDLLRLRMPPRPPAGRSRKKSSLPFRKDLENVAPLG